MWDKSLHSCVFTCGLLEYMLRYNLIATKATIFQSGNAIEICNRDWRVIHFPLLTILIMNFLVLFSWEQNCSTDKSIWEKLIYRHKKLSKDFWRFWVPLGAIYGWPTFPKFSTCHHLSCLSNIFSCEHRKRLQINRGC